MRFLSTWFGKQSKPASRQSRRTNSRGLSLEHLERRELMAGNLLSATALPVVDYGVLTIEDVEQDSLGSTYVAGKFGRQYSDITAQVDLDPARTYADARDILISVGQTTTGLLNDGFVVKYNAAGEIEWTLHGSYVLGIDGTTNTTANLEISELTIGSSGGIYFGGAYQGSVDVGGNVLPLQGAYLQDRNRFVGAISPSGAVDWIKGFDTVRIDSTPNGLVVDEPRSRLYVASSQFIDSLVNSGGETQAQVIAYDFSTPSDVRIVWQAGLSVTSTAFDVLVDADGAVYAGGWFQGEADFDPGPAKATLSSGKSGGSYVSAGFLWKLQANGSLAWAHAFAGSKSSSSFIEQLAWDPSGNLIAAGSFTGTIDFNPGKAIKNLSSVGGRDAFWARYSRDGAFMLATSLGTSYDDIVSDVVADASGNVYLAFRSRNTSTITKFNASGVKQWSRQITSSQSLGKLNLSLDATNRLHAIGVATGDLNTSGGTLDDPEDDGQGFWLVFD